LGRLIELPNAACNGFRHAACNGFRHAACNGFRNAEPVARGIEQLNQAAIHAADSWTLKSPTSGPNNAPAMVPLAATFTLFKALA
jgi:hypothetical protein